VDSGSRNCRPVLAADMCHSCGPCETLCGGRLQFRDAPCQVVWKRPDYSTPVGKYTLPITFRKGPSLMHLACVVNTDDAARENLLSRNFMICALHLVSLQELPGLHTVSRLLTQRVFIFCFGNVRHNRPRWRRFRSQQSDCVDIISLTMLNKFSSCL